jgi:hypothetical protein
MNWVKIVSLSSDSLPKDVMDKLVNAVCPEEGKEKCLQWELHDNGRLDLYVEDICSSSSHCTKR